MKILFTTQLPTEGFARLSSHELDMPATPYYSPEELGIRIADADILVATFDYRITREMIEAWSVAKRPLNGSAASYKLIANLGVGYNNIDLDACREYNILVTNTPLPVIEPTAELCFALMHAVARCTALFDRQLRQGTAEPFGVMNNLSHSLYGKTLGIIGMGRIGKAVARRAIASGMRVIYYQRHPLEETSGTSSTSLTSFTSSTSFTSFASINYVPLDELLREADFVSLHLPYTPETHHIIGERELSLMKPTAYLINTARGAHVDEASLVRFLQEKKIAGAALDVYEHEPDINEALKSLDNVVLSPHTGTATMEARLAMCENVTDNILAFLAGQFDSMNQVY